LFQFLSQSGVSEEQRLLVIASFAHTKRSSGKPNATLISRLVDEMAETLSSAEGAAFASTLHSLTGQNLGANVSAWRVYSHDLEQQTREER
jgi:hypothetical protein